jgi:hypothetical protein
MNIYARVARFHLNLNGATVTPNLVNRHSRHPTYEHLSKEQVMAVFAELEKHHSLNPRALVTTGGKSLHAWFDWPTGTDAGDWAAVLKGYACDPATLPLSQPVRLPGIIRPDTGRPQELLLIGD